MPTKSEKPTVLLLGAGGHARSCIDVIECEDRYAIAGVIGLPSERGGSLFGYPILATDDELPEVLPKFDFGLVTCGQIKTATVRRRLFDAVMRYGSLPDAMVSPRAYVSRRASVGKGTVVFPGAVVNAGAVVGENCIVNSLSLIEHDVVVGNHCHIATGARVNSGVTVGDGTFLGSGSVVRQGIRIGSDCVIGMGVSVLKDCADGVLFMGKKS